MTPQQFIESIKSASRVSAGDVTANLESVLSTMTDTEICFFLHECETVFDGMEQDILKQAVGNGVGIYARVKKAKEQAETIAASADKFL